MTVRAAFRAVVFKGDRDNEILVSVQTVDPTVVPEAPQPISWSGVSRMVLEVRHPTTGVLVATADTGVDANLIDFGTDGQLTLRLSSMTSVPNGDYVVRISAISGVNTTQIVHEARDNMVLSFTSTTDHTA